MKILINSVIYWLIQAIGALLIAYAGKTEGWKFKGFVLSNILFVISIYFFIKLCQLMPSNVASATAIGGAFLLAQIALVIVFKEKLVWMQIVGVFFILSGMMLMIFGKELFKF